MFGASPGKITHLPASSTNAECTTSFLCNPLAAESGRSTEFPFLAVGASIVFGLVKKLRPHPRRVNSRKAGKPEVILHLDRIGPEKRDYRNVGY
jgi:hypothetical protein